MMDEQQFDRLMRTVDDELSQKSTPILGRIFMAYGKLTGQGTEKVVAPGGSYDPNIGQHEGVNLLNVISDWYAKMYPKQATVPERFGQRPILIKGQVFPVNIPLIFNPKEEISVFEHINDLSERLVTRLTNEEKNKIQRSFNVMFTQETILSLASLRIKEYTWSNVTSALQFIQRGHTDLLTTCESFLTSDGSAIIWGMNQAVEKYLKAFLLLCDDSLNPDLVRKKHGHNIEKLLNTAASHNSTFKKILEKGIDFSEGTSVRYQKTEIPPYQQVEKVNAAFHVCYTVGLIILESKGNQSDLSKELHEE